MNIPSDGQNEPSRSSRNSNNKTYNTRELADLLGVSRHTIYRMRAGGELPRTIPTQRRVIRWQAKDIELWFDLDCPNAKNFARLKMDLQRFTQNRSNRPNNKRGDR